ncbi:MAG: class I SAM-dependent methyltransferase [Pseudomonadota bacterium]
MKETFLAKFFYTFPLAYQIGDALVHFPDLGFKRFSQIDILPRDGLTLELACGTGRSSRIFKGKQLTVVNLDINKAFVAYGKKTGRLSNPVVGSAYGLCFRENVFDQIIIPDAFHHLLDHEQVFKECRRILKPGGEFIIFDIVSRKKGPNKIVNHFADGIIWIMDHSFFVKKINDLAAAHGFMLRDVKTKQGKTIMGLIGGIDIQAKLVKQ